MDEEDYLSLIELVTGLLREIGLDDVADNVNYLEFFDLSDERASRLMEPKEHLLAILEAFDTQVMLRDGGVLRRSLDSINESCRGKGPSSVSLTIPRRGEGVEYVPLDNLPDIGKLRRQLRRLINQLQETPRGREPEVSR